MSYHSHFSVLGEECLLWMINNSDSESKGPLFFADMTFGGGGHSLALIKANESNKVLAVDQDPDAIKNGQEMLSHLPASLSARLELLHMNFSEFPSFIQTGESGFSKNKDFSGFSGIILDLGVSSHHFDEGSRGFSFNKEAALDMRMDNSRDIPTAADILESFSEEELANIFFEFGEEKFSRRIARAIVKERENKNLETTSQLEEIIFSCYPKNLRRGRIHPATRCFQALRIAVNRELEVLRVTLPQLFSLLAIGGRLLVISFHSLEDRIVKHSFKHLVELNPQQAKIHTKKPIIPSENEIKKNSRSRSAKLRIIERL